MVASFLGSSAAASFRVQSFGLKLGARGLCLTWGLGFRAAGAAMRSVPACTCVHRQVLPCIVRIMPTSLIKHTRHRVASVAVCQAVFRPVPTAVLVCVFRTPAHCIEYAHLIKWSHERQEEEFDADNEQHMIWIYTNALERAKQYGIEVRHSHQYSSVVQDPRQYGMEG